MDIFVQTTTEDNSFITDVNNGTWFDLKKISLL